MLSLTFGLRCAVFAGMIKYRHENNENTSKTTSKHHIAVGGAACSLADGHHTFAPGRRVAGTSGSLVAFPCDRVVVGCLFGDPWRGSFAGSPLGKQPAAPPAARRIKVVKIATALEAIEFLQSLPPREN